MTKKIVSEWRPLDAESLRPIVGMKGQDAGQLFHRVLASSSEVPSEVIGRFGLEFQLPQGPKVSDIRLNFPRGSFHEVHAARPFTVVLNHSAWITTDITVDALVGTLVRVPPSKRIDRYNRWCDEIEPGGFVKCSGQRDSKSWRKVIQVKAFDIVGMKYTRPIDRDEYMTPYSSENDISTVVEYIPPRTRE